MSKSDKIMDARTAAETALLEDSVAALLHDSMLVKYRPIRGTNSRLIKVVNTAEDPLQPPKFRYRKIPRAGRDSPPPVVLQSPPRQLTAEDIKNSRVPPCVSLWKNPKGYAIPLDKRHSAAGLEAEISHRMVDLAEALYVADEKIRDEVALRSKMRRELEMIEKERRDVELLRLARRVRDECGGREGKKRRNVGGEESKKKKKKRRSRREGGGLTASTEGEMKGEMMFVRSLVDAYGDGDGERDEVKTMMKMRERERPVEFEKEDVIADLFGLDEFLSKLNY